MWCDGVGIRRKKKIVWIPGTCLRKVGMLEVTWRTLQGLKIFRGMNALQSVMNCGRSIQHRFHTSVRSVAELGFENVLPFLLFSLFIIAWRKGLMGYEHNMPARTIIEKINSNLWVAVCYFPCEEGALSIGSVKLPSVFYIVQCFAADWLFNLISKEGRSMLSNCWIFRYV